MDEPMCAEEIYFFLKGAKQEEIDIIFEWALAAKR